MIKITPTEQLLAEFKISHIEQSESCDTIDAYLDRYDNLSELTDVIFQNAIEGGFINLTRCAELGAWFEVNPLIAALAPYPCLIGALKKCAHTGHWNNDTELAMLRFIAVFGPNRDSYYTENQLNQLPVELFGDVYLGIFDHPDTSIDLQGQTIEVTGPCLIGSHNVLYKAAEVFGGKRARGVMRSGYLFVAQSHIDSRIISSKIMEAVHMRLKYGKLKIVSEEYFPQPLNTAIHG